MNVLEYYTYSKNGNYVTRMFWITNDDVMFLKIDYYETNLLECSSPQGAVSFEEGAKMWLAWYLPCLVGPSENELLQLPTGS